MLAYQANGRAATAVITKNGPSLNVKKRRGGVAILGPSQRKVLLPAGRPSLLRRLVWVDAFFELDFDSAERLLTRINTLLDFGHSLAVHEPGLCGAVDSDA